MVVSSSARFFKVVNKCRHDIMVKTLGNAGLPSLGERKLVGFGATTNFNFPHRWSGRLWANNSPGGTLFEIATNRAKDLDYYNISVIDGYNFPMIVGPMDGGGAECRQYKCLNYKSCEGYFKPDDDRWRKVVSACKNANYQVILSP